MADKGHQTNPYMFDDDEMQENFQRPIARGRSFYLENFISLPEIYNVFEFQGCWDFLRILEDIYRGVVPTFYNTLNVSDEDNTSLKSIVKSF